MKNSEEEWWWIVAYQLNILKDSYDGKFYVIRILTKFKTKQQQKVSIVSILEKQKQFQGFQEDFYI